MNTAMPLFSPKFIRFAMLALLLPFGLGCKGKTYVPKPDLGYTYYVSADFGNDRADGTIARPLRSIQEAVDRAEAGNTIGILEGRYREAVTVRHSGRDDAYITLRSYPGDKVIIDGAGIALEIPNQALIMLYDANYIRIDGLEVVNSQSAGIYGKAGASHIEVVNCSIADCLAPGICFGADFIATSHISVLNNFVDNCSSVSREAISLRTVDSFEIAHNTVVNVLKESIDAKTGCKNGSIHHNSIDNAGVCAIYLDAGYHDRPVNDGQYNIAVYQNKIVNPRALGICVASEMGANSRDIRIYNNLIYDMYAGQGSAIKVGDHTDPASDRRGELKNIYIYHNTVYGRGQQGIYINHSLIENIVVRNNISVMNRMQQLKIKENVGIDHSQIIIENNLLWGASAGDDIGTNAVLYAPEFVDVQAGNFALRAASPAIDGATPTTVADSDFIGTLRPQGAGYDIGAYEYIP